MMNIGEIIGILNDASLKIGQAVASIEQSSQVLDTAVDEAMEARNSIATVISQAEVQSLNAALEKMRESMAKMRGSQNSNMEAILQANGATDVIAEYIGRLYG